MIMADVLTWFLIVTGIFLTLNAWWLASVALFPRVTEGCRERYGRRPVLGTVLGLGILTPTLVAGIGIGKVVPNPGLKAIVAGMAMLPVLVALLGSAGLALRIGAGLASPHDGSQPWKRALRGGPVLGLTFLLPFVGWFMVLPWVLVSGFGICVMTVLAGGTARAAQPAPAATAAASPAAAIPETPATAPSAPVPAS